MPYQSNQEKQKEIDRLKKDNAKEEREKARLKAEKKWLEDQIRKEFGTGKKNGSQHERKLKTTVFDVSIIFFQKWSKMLDLP